MTTEDMEAELARLRAENAALKQPKTLTCKVGEKGGMSLYGLGRFPVTLYKDQWRRLLAFSESIEAFLEENEAALKDKDDK